MTYWQAVAYLLRYGFEKSLINKMGKRRTIKIAMLHKERTK